MPNSWITHCQNYQKQHGCTYSEAMKKSRSSYTKSKKNNNKKKKTKRGGALPNPSDMEEHFKRKEKAGQSWLDDLEKRVKAGDGKYGQDSVQKSILHTKAKQDSKRAVQHLPPASNPEPKVKRRIVPTLVRNSRSSPSSAISQLTCKSKGTAYVKPHCRKKGGKKKEKKKK